MDRDMLDIYTDYLICQNQYATATGLSRLVDGELSHDQVTRFLNKNELGSKNLWKYVKPEIRKREQEKGGIFIVDDTILLIFIDENCPNIKQLKLPWDIRDDFLISLPKRLTSLNLRGCRQITDTRLSYLRPLTRLTTLNLTYCRRITDTGLSHLSSLTGLTTLGLSYCNRISDKSIETFKSNFDSIEISR